MQASGRKFIYARNERSQVSIARSAVKGVGSAFFSLQKYFFTIPAPLKSQRNAAEIPADSEDNLCCMPLTFLETQYSASPGAPEFQKEALSDKKRPNE